MYAGDLQLPLEHVAHRTPATACSTGGASMQLVNCWGNFYSTQEVAAPCSILTAHLGGWAGFCVTGPVSDVSHVTSQVVLCTEIP